MLNKVSFIGHLGRDPEIRIIGSTGASAASFSVAATERWKDKSTGEMREETEWLRCTAFDRLAEIVGQYLVKGSLIYVEGPLKTRKYVDKDGVEKQITECRVMTMKMLGGKGDRQDAQHEAQPSARAPAKPPTARVPIARTATAQAAPTSWEDMDSDIPF
jgi:single-strand DNA-binding protein